MLKSAQWVDRQDCVPLCVKTCMDVSSCVGGLFVKQQQKTEHTSLNDEKPNRTKLLSSRFFSPNGI